MTRKYGETFLPLLHVQKQNERKGLSFLFVSERWCEVKCVQIKFCLNIYPISSLISRHVGIVHGHLAATNAWHATREFFTSPFKLPFRGKYVGTWIKLLWFFCEAHHTYSSPACSPNNKEYALILLLEYLLWSQRESSKFTRMAPPSL